MADIFISYARADRDKVEMLAAALEAEGYSVWWDRQIVGGAEFSEEIEKELTAAKAVIVAWSAHSIKSTWVKDEALTARDQGKLIPVGLDGAVAPMGFKQFHLIDCANWKGEPQAHAFQDLSRAVKARLTGEVQAAPAAALKASWTDKLLKPVPLAVIGAAAIAVVGVFMWQTNRNEPLLEAVQSAAPLNEGSTTLSNPHSETPTQQASKDSHETPHPLAEAPANSIAVLPFADMSAAGDQEYFTDGLTEEILNVLAKSGELRVAGRTSSFQFKGQNQDLRAIGQTLGVAHILEGSVRKSGDDMRITAQLIKADDGFHLWSETYDRKLSDIFRVQEEIATAIGDALNAPLGVNSTALENNRTDNPEAYQLYLEGLALWFRRGENLIPAIEKLERAVALEPEFAAAWAALSLSYQVTPDYISEIDGRPLNRAAFELKMNRAARTALRHNGELVSAHHAMANVLRAQFQWLDAEDHYLRALEIEPDAHAVMEDYRQLLGIVGHYEKSDELALKMIALDPLNPLYQMNQAERVWFPYADASSLDAFLKIFNDYPQLRNVVGGFLMNVYLHEKRPADAATLAKACSQCNPQRQETMIAMLEQIQDPKPDFVITESMRTLPYGSRLNYLVGGSDALLDWIDYMAFERHAPLFAGLYDLDRVTPVLNTPRYNQLLTDIGLPAYWRERGWPKDCRPLNDGDFECKFPVE